MLPISGGHGRRLPGRRRRPGHRSPRLLALMGVVTAVAVLPLAVASARQGGEAARHTVSEKPRAVVRAPGQAFGHAPGQAFGHEGAVRLSRDGDAKMPSPGASPRVLGLGLAAAARCGPALTSPDGIEAQTCVLTQGADTWARTYYRNTSGEPLDAALSLMGPGGRTTQLGCVTGTDDEPATCETPREPSRGGPDAYTAVSEFAKHGSDGALLLRSGSDPADASGNSGDPQGS